MLSSDFSQCMYSGGAGSWLRSGINPINPGVYKARPCLPAVLSRSVNQAPGTGKASRSPGRKLCPAGSSRWVAPSGREGSQRSPPQLSASRRDGQLLPSTAELHPQGYQN